MNNVIQISDYIDEWKQLIRMDTIESSLALYVNVRTNELELVQTNDDGESICTRLSAVESTLMSEMIRNAQDGKFNG